MQLHMLGSVSFQRLWLQSNQPPSFINFNDQSPVKRFALRSLFVQLWQVGCICWHVPIHKVLYLRMKATLVMHSFRIQKCIWTHAQGWSKLGSCQR